MFNPLFASSFEGVEIIFFVPALMLAGLIGFLFAWGRAREMAVMFAVICGLIGLLALAFAIVMHEIRARIADGICGLAGIAFALLLFLIKRKNKDPMSKK
jgi:cyanate permease